ncbi:MAG: pantoate--beta-alanine ligase [Chlorobiaceae bacterium]|nr:pantoate--beta-alanine ligase [Chlorobiaceae bacterium]MBA4309360.1 pantoate--beta-alanine ligase [Chlorobiaceae bacterium]
MRIISTIQEIQTLVENYRLQKKIIGFVPTMGYLHDGHLSLLKYSKEKADVSIVSIFVNPTQFSPTEDLSKYPRNIQRDQELLEKNGCDILFFPDAEEIYPKNFQTYVEVEKITSLLEGEIRQTHFKGVTTVVAILFNAVKPHYAFFGQKDAQQAAVIKQMVSDLKMDLKIVVCPIVREADGLAMSSRNVYLSGSERADATQLNRTLIFAKGMVENGERDVKKIIEESKQLITNIDSANLDYLSIVDADTFEVVEKLIEGKKYFILIACKIGATRLIDNLLITV